MIYHYPVISLSSLCLQMTQHLIPNLAMQMELQIMTLNWKINNELSNINDWLKINKLSLDIKQSKYMISTKAHTEPTKLEYRICKCLQRFRIDYRLAFNMGTSHYKHVK